MTQTDNDTSWVRLDLSPEQIEFGFIDIIRAEVEEIWISRGALEGFTVWLLETPSNTEMYFSPVAAVVCRLLLMQFNGTPCPIPKLDSLTFLIGHAYVDSTPANGISS